MKTKEFSWIRNPKERKKVIDRQRRYQAAANIDNIPDFKPRKSKPTVAQKLHIDQKEPTGPLQPWEMDWLRECGWIK